MMCDIASRGPVPAAPDGVTLGDDGTNGGAPACHDELTRLLLPLRERRRSGKPQIALSR